MPDDVPPPPSSLTGAKLYAAATPEVRALVDGAWAAGVEEGERRATAVGPMLAAVQHDLDRMNVDGIPAGRTLATMAQWLAGVIDSRGSDEGPSTTAKLADQLGKTMGALTRRAGGDEGGFDGDSADLSTPSAG